MSLILAAVLCAAAPAPAPAAPAAREVLPAPAPDEWPELPPLSDLARFHVRPDDAHEMWRVLFRDRDVWESLAALPHHDSHPLTHAYYQSRSEYTRGAYMLWDRLDDALNPAYGSEHCRRERLAELKALLSDDAWEAGWMPPRIPPPDCP